MMICIKSRSTVCRFVVFCHPRRADASRCYDINQCFGPTDFVPDRYLWFPEACGRATGRGVGEQEHCDGASATSAIWKDSAVLRSRWQGQATLTPQTVRMTLRTDLRRHRQFSRAFVKLSEQSRPCNHSSRHCGVRYMAHRTTRLRLPKRRRQSHDE